MLLKHSENTETLKAVEEKVVSKKQNSIIIYNFVDVVVGVVMDIVVYISYKYVSPIKY